MYKMLGALVIWMVGVGLAVKDEPKPEVTAQTEDKSAISSSSIQASVTPAKGPVQLKPMEQAPVHHAAVTTELIPVSFGTKSVAQTPSVRSSDAPAGYAPLPQAKTDFAEPSPELPVYEVTGSRVNMRAGPSTGHAVVAALGKGTQTQFLGQHQGWAQIKVIDTGARGFMSVKFLKPVATN